MNRPFLFISTVALVVSLSTGFAQDTDVAKLQAEADAVKVELAAHPTFKKFYDHLKAHPESLPTNGPKLAAMMWQEAKDNKTIRDHAPSYVAMLQEVERLAAAGRDTKLALQAVDAQVAHNADLLPDAKARLTKSRLIADAAKAAGEPRVKPQDRAETREWVEKLLTDAIDAGDEPVVGEMLAAQGQLAKTSTERLDAGVALLAVADEQLQSDRPAIATKLIDHVGELLKNATAAKGKKEATDALTALKTRVATASAAEAARQTLATQPTDPAANQAVGMHLLVNRGDWKEAILHLALGADAAWKTLAADTIAAGEDGKSKAALAERWAALEKDPKGPSKRIARDLFQEALADKSLVGLPRAAAEQKLKALGPFEEVKTVAKPELKKPDPVKPKVVAKPKTYGPAIITATGRKTIVVEHDDQYPPELRGRVTKYEWENPPKQGEADVGKGAVEFTVDETGVLYLFGSWGNQGNSGGGWVEERLMPEGLVAQGWESVGKTPGDDKGGIFRKLVTKGEKYRLRVNKYAPPVLFTTLPSETAKPTTSSTTRPAGKALPLNKPIDVLTLFDFNEDVVRGYFYPTSGGVKVDGSYGSRIRVPIDLTNCSYDVDLDIELPYNGDDVYVVLPVGANQVLLAVDAFDKKQVTCFTNIRGSTSENTPHAVRGDLLQAKKSYRYSVTVRLRGDEALLTFLLDGKKICEYQGSSRELTPHGDWLVGSSGLLALGGQSVQILYTGARITVREGDARYTRTAPIPDPFPANIKDLPSQSLTTLEPLSANVRGGKLLISKGTHDPLVNGELCRDYLHTHAPSKVVYAIPPKAKYFTAYACSATDPRVRYIVRVDGKAVFTCEHRAITPVLIELPAGAKELELETDPLGDNSWDQSCWAFPAFRLPSEPAKSTSIRPTVPEKKLALNKPIDLLPLLDFNEDTVRGFFYPTSRGVHVDRHHESRMRFPVDLTNCSYDVELDFELPEMGESVYLILPVGAHQVLLVVDGFEQDQTTCFTNIRGAEGKSLPHAVRGDLLQAKKPHHYLMSVRLKGGDATLTFNLDGKKICEYQGPSNELSNHRNWLIGSNGLLGFGAHDAPALFTGARLTVREGEAKQTRSAPVPDPLADKMIKDRPAQSLLTLSPLSATVHGGKLLVSEGTHAPLIHGQPCREFLCAHAPSKVVYAIPPKAKYFTAYACCGTSPSVKYIVWVDGKSLFTCENRAITPVLVELPAGAKEMTLEVDHLGDFGYDQSCWAYPAFR